MVRLSFGSAEFKQQTGCTLYNNSTFDFQEPGQERPGLTTPVKRNNLFDDEDFASSQSKKSSSSKWRFGGTGGLFDREQRIQTNVDAVAIEQESDTQSIPSPRAEAPSPGFPIASFRTQGPPRTPENPASMESIARWEVDIKRLFSSDNKVEAVSKTAPSLGLVRCYLKRYKNILGQTTYYALYLNNGLHIMSARRRKKSKTSNYVLGLSNEDLHKNNCVCKLRANFGCSEYTLCSRQNTSADYSVEEISIVVQHVNTIGRGGPARIVTMLPSPDLASNNLGEEKLTTLISKALRREMSPASEQRVAVLASRPPEWDEELKTYTLDFHGRVKEASVKNFQLVAWDHNSDRRGSDVLLQFGRLDDTCFILDFSYPFNLKRAFAAALASFDSSSKH